MCLPSNPLASIALTLLLLGSFVATAAPLYTNEDRVTLQERRKLADQEMVRRTFNLAEWQGYFDEKNSYWERAAEWRRGSDRPEARAYHERIKSQLRGKR